MTFSDLHRHRAAAARLLAALLAGLLLSMAPAAQALDPRLEWRTLETPHFSVHYHQGLDELGRRAAHYAELALSRLGPFLERWPDEKIQVVLSDTTDSANGSATAYLRATMRLNAVAPDNRSELGDHDDWLWNLVVHELTHVLHLGDIGGLPAVVDTLLGQRWVPNAIQPNWFIEGLAIFSESRLSSGGRNRSSLYDMYLRMAALEGTWPGLDDISGSPSRWPYGAMPYLYGSRFLEWVAHQQGSRMFRQMSHDYGSDWFPFLFNWTAARWTGERWTTLYAAWSEEEQARLLAFSEARRSQGLSPVRKLSQAGGQTGAARFCGGGKRLCYVEASETRRPALRSRDLETGEERLHAELFSVGTLALSPDSKRAVVSQKVTFDTYATFEDLFWVELDSGKMERLTLGARATEPDFSPDGRSLIFAQRLAGGRRALARLDLATRAIEILYEPPAPGGLYTPRFAPEGDRVVFSLQGVDGRDLAEFHLETRQVRRLTHERAMELDPAFDPLGKWLFFSSDRDGVFEIYAQERSTGELRRVTRLLSGGFEPSPSPDGRRLALVTYSSQGSDVAVLPLEPAAFEPVSAPTLARPAPPQLGEPPPLPDRAYRPLRTLAPLGWLPWMDDDAVGLRLGLSTFGEDAVGRHAWTLNLGLGFASGAFSGDASYVYRGLRPELGVAASSQFAVVQSLPERQWRLRLSARWPFGGPDWSLSLAVGYELRVDEPLFRTRLPLDPLAPAKPRLDTSPDVTSSLFAQVSWSNAWGPIQGVSPGTGWRLGLALKGARPEFGSDFSYTTVEASATRYFTMPWHDLHVIALRLGGGLSLGEAGWRGVFTLGGKGLQNPLSALIDGTALSGVALRGYGQNAFFGTRYGLLNGEYRFPIAVLDRGLWTLPLYLKRLHGAITADLGWIGTQAPRLDELKPSVGAELHLTLLLGYDFLTEFQVGYARGLGPEGANNFFLGIGSGF